MISKNSKKTNQKIKNQIKFKNIFFLFLSINKNVK